MTRQGRSTPTHHPTRVENVALRPSQRLSYGPSRPTGATL